MNFLSCVCRMATLGEEPRTLFVLIIHGKGKFAALLSEEKAA